MKKSQDSYPSLSMSTCLVYKQESSLCRFDAEKYKFKEKPTLHFAYFLLWDLTENNNLNIICSGWVQVMLEMKDIGRKCAWAWLG